MKNLIKAVKDYLDAYDDWMSTQVHSKVHLVNDKRRELRDELKKVHLGGIIPRSLQTMTTTELGGLCGRTPQTIIHWMEKKQFFKGERVLTSPRKITTTEVAPFLLMYFSQTYPSLEHIYEALRKFREERETARIERKKLYRV